MLQRSRAPRDRLRGGPGRGEVAGQRRAALDGERRRRRRWGLVVLALEAIEPVLTPAEAVDEPAGLDRAEAGVDGQPHARRPHLLGTLGHGRPGLAPVIDIALADPGDRDPPRQAVAGAAPPRGAAEARRRPEEGELSASPADLLVTDRAGDETVEGLVHRARGPGPGVGGIGDRDDQQRVRGGQLRSGLQQLNLHLGILRGESDRARITGERLPSPGPPTVAGAPARDSLLG